MTFLLPVNITTPGSTDLHRQLLAGGVRQELVLLLGGLDVLGAAGGLIDRPALLGTLASTDLTIRRSLDLSERGNKKEIVIGWFQVEDKSSVGLH